MDCHLSAINVGQPLQHTHSCGGQALHNLSRYTLCHRRGCTWDMTSAQLLSGLLNSSKSRGHWALPQGYGQCQAGAEL